jgi:hypothetical protein
VIVIAPGNASTFASDLGSLAEVWPPRSVPRATRMRGAVCTVTIDLLSRICLETYLGLQPVHEHASLFILFSLHAPSLAVLLFAHTVMAAMKRTARAGIRATMRVRRPYPCLRFVSGQRWGERPGPIRPRPLTVSGEVRVVVPTHVRILAGRGLCSTPKRMRRLLPQTTNRAAASSLVSLISRMSRCVVSFSLSPFYPHRA